MSSTQIDDPSTMLNTIAGAGEQRFAEAGQVATAAGKDMKAQARKAETAGTAAITTRQGQEEAKATGQAPIFQEYLDKAGKIDSDFTGMMAQAKQQKEEGLNRYLTTVDDYKNTHIYNWWAEAGTGAKILGVLSQALAGGLQGLTGQAGPTPLDKIIEQDLQRQKLNLAQKGESAQLAGGIYKDLLANLKDNVLAEGAARDIAYNSTIHRAEAYAAKLGNGEAKAKAQEAIAGLYKTMAENRQSIDKYLGESSLHGAAASTGFETNMAQLFGAARGQDIDLAKAQAEADAKRKSSVGLTGIPGSEKLPAVIGNANFEKVKTAWDAVPTIQEDAKKIKNLMTGSGQKLPNEERSAELDQYTNDLVLKIRKAEDIARLSGPDIVLFKKIQAIPTSQLELGLQGIKDYLSGTGLMTKFRTSEDLAKAITRLADAYTEQVKKRISSYTVDGKPLQVPESEK